VPLNAFINSTHGLHHSRHPPSREETKTPPPHDGESCFFKNQLIATEASGISPPAFKDAKATSRLTSRKIHSRQISNNHPPFPPPPTTNPPTIDTAKGLKLVFPPLDQIPCSSSGLFSSFLYEDSSRVLSKRFFCPFLTGAQPVGFAFFSHPLQVGTGACHTPRGEFPAQATQPFLPLTTAFTPPFCFPLLVVLRLTSSSSLADTKFRPEALPHSKERIPDVDGFPFTKYAFALEIREHPSKSAARHIRRWSSWMAFFFLEIEVNDLLPRDLCLGETPGAPPFIVWPKDLTALRLFHFN